VSTSEEIYQRIHINTRTHAHTHAHTHTHPHTLAVAQYDTVSTGHVLSSFVRMTLLTSTMTHLGDNDPRFTGEGAALNH